jgi:hypothetical protein
MLGDGLLSLLRALGGVARSFCWRLLNALDRADEPAQATDITPHYAGYDSAGRQIRLSSESGPDGLTPFVADSVSSFELFRGKEIYLHLRCFRAERLIRQHLVVRDRALLKQLRPGQKGRCVMALADYALPEGANFQEASQTCVSQAIALVGQWKEAKKALPAQAAPSKSVLLVGSDALAGGLASRNDLTSDHAADGKTTRGFLRYCGQMDGVNHGTGEIYRSYGIQIEVAGGQGSAVTYMGADLERAVKMANAVVGDLIELRFEGYQKAAAATPGGRSNRKKKWSIDVLDAKGGVR